MLYEDLLKSYKKLSKQRRLRTFVREGVGIIAIFGLMPVLAVWMGIIPISDLTLRTIIGTIVTVGYAVLILKMIHYRLHTKPLANHLSIFLDFFSVYQGLHELKLSYQKKQEESYDDGIKKAKTSIDDFILIISNWTSYFAPSSLTYVQTSIHDTLKKIIPLVTNKEKHEQFCLFAEYLFDICNLLYKRDLSFEEWMEFKNELGKFGIEDKDTEKTIKKITSTQTKEFLLRKEVIGGFSWVLSFFLLYGNTELYIALSSSAAIAGSAAYIFSREKIAVRIIKRNDNST